MMKRSREELIRIADFGSAFLFIRLPVYILEEFLETNKSDKIKKWIKEELKPNSSITPSQIIKSIRDVYM